TSSPARRSPSPPSPRRLLRLAFRSPRSAPPAASTWPARACSLSRLKSCGKATRIGSRTSCPARADRPPGAWIGDRPMAMPASDIEALIKQALPDAKVTLRDLAGDGDHYAAEVVSEAFRGKNRVQQHQ